MKKKTYIDEIDLFDVISNLSKNKFKILIITTLFLISGLLYYHFLDKNYVAKTNIKPGSTFENQKYKIFNTFAGEDLINVNSENLFNLFISKIQTEEIIENGIIKFQLLDKDSFKNEKDYNEAIKRNAILIIDKMIAPFNDEVNIEKNIPYWQYNFTVKDKISWRNFLEYVQKQANKEIRLSLINQFDTQIKILNRQSKIQLEDIDQDIANALDDYKTSISNRLAFLKEQAEIARTLNIAKNTLEVENFQTDNTIVTNIKSVNSYYFKGYEMIEKEISLINSRKNEKAFIENLVEFEKTKRSILQDKKIERLKFLFSGTPISNKSDFIAGKIDYVATLYKPEQSILKIFSISIFIGLIISFVYLFINNILASRK